MPRRSLGSLKVLFNTAHRIKTVIQQFEAIRHCYRYKALRIFNRPPRRSIGLIRSIKGYKFQNYLKNCLSPYKIASRPEMRGRGVSERVSGPRSFGWKGEPDILLSALSREP
jgi:hypothetical protein